jgi:hypothetical protein
MVLWQQDYPAGHPAKQRSKHDRVPAHISHASSFPVILQWAGFPHVIAHVHPRAPCCGRYNDFPAICIATQGPVSILSIVPFQGLSSHARKFVVGTGHSCVTSVCCSHPVFVLSNQRPVGAKAKGSI